MRIYTIHDVCKIVERMMSEYHIGLGKAVQNVSASYGFSEDQIYKYMVDHNIAGQGNE